MPWEPGLFHRVSHVHHRQERAQGHPQCRRRHRFICYSGLSPCWASTSASPERLVHLLHANVHSMLRRSPSASPVPGGPRHRVCAPDPGEPELGEIRDFTSSVTTSTHHGRLCGHRTFLSFFHQGSLGGMFGVMYARPFAARWSFTFGPPPSFFSCSRLLPQGRASPYDHPADGGVTRKKLSLTSHPDPGPDRGWLLAVYMVLKIADTLAWAWVSCQIRAHLHGFLQRGPYGVWLLVARSASSESSGPSSSDSRARKTFRAAPGLPDELCGNRAEPICLHRVTLAIR